MPNTVSSKHIFNKHLYLGISKKEQSIWAFFLAFCLFTTVSLTLGFEHIGGYLPCDLCLIERYPYYSAIPFLLLAGFVSLFCQTPSFVRFLFLCVLILMTISFILAIYHTGIEYGFWPGPSSCSSNTAKFTTNATQLLDQLNDIIPPSCSEAQGRFLSLSFAGWNVVASTFYMLASLYITSKGIFSNCKK
ncbi:disulfide bond formation protein B [Bartonella sp. B41]